MIDAQHVGIAGRVKGEPLYMLTERGKQIVKGFDDVPDATTTTEKS